MDVFVVITEDRHADTEAEVFTRQPDAEARAREIAGGYDRGQLDPLDLDESLSPSMLRDGWVLHLPCTGEGDCVRVVRRELHGPVPAARAGQQR